MPTKAISLRVPLDALDEIDRRVRARGVTRTTFILDVVLDRCTDDEDRFERIETRLERLEANQWAS